MKITYQPLVSRGPVTVEQAENNLLVNGKPLRLRGGDDRFALEGEADDLSLAVGLDHLFGQNPSLLSVEVSRAPAYFTRPVITRGEFFQWPLPWHHRGGYELHPEVWTSTNERRHPQRPASVAGTLYRRYAPAK